MDFIECLVHYAVNLILQKPVRISENLFFVDSILNRMEGSLEISTILVNRQRCSALQNWNVFMEFTIYTHFVFQIFLSTK